MTEPVPESNHIEAARAVLQQTFGVTQMDAATIKLVEFLIRQIPPDMFQPADTDLRWLDFVFFDILKYLVEEQGSVLADAYREIDRVFDQPPGRTAARFDSLSLMVVKGVK